MDLMRYWGLQMAALFFDLVGQTLVLGKYFAVCYESLIFLLNFDFMMYKSRTVLFFLPSKSGY